MRIFNVRVGDVLLVQLSANKFIVRVESFLADSYFVGSYRMFSRESGRYNGAVELGHFPISAIESVRCTNPEHFEN